jgi:hypothetical protein
MIFVLVTNRGVALINRIQQVYLKTLRYLMRNPPAFLFYPLRILLQISIGGFVMWSKKYL